MHPLSFISSGRTCKCSLQQSFKCAEQLQFLPRVTGCHQQPAGTPSASNQQLIDWSFDEDQQDGPILKSRIDHQQHSVPQLGSQANAKEQTRRQQHGGTARQRQSSKQQKQRLTPRMGGGQAAKRSSATADVDSGLLAETLPERQQSSWTSDEQQPITAEAPRMQVHERQNTRHRQLESPVDEYAAAQQRVRQLLVSADVNNPLAAAAAIPDTVNDIVIALQLLATAPKPSTMMAMKQYELARQQMAAAVVRKFKHLLMDRHQQQEHEEYSEPSAAVTTSQLLHQGRVQLPMTSPAAAAVPGLAAALMGLPATKVAAATFSLGVLRHYDPDLVPALEQASGRLMSDTLATIEQQNCHAKHKARSGSSDSSISTRRTITQQSINRQQHPQKQQAQQQQQQQQQPQQQNSVALDASAFNANQLGQLCQGFVYLDHPLDPQWQAVYLASCRHQMRFMKPQQLASVAEFLLRYRYSSSSSSAGNVAGLYQGLDSSGPPPHDCVCCLDDAWAAMYLRAAAAQVGSMRPSQLVPVLQAAAGMYAGWQQEHHGQLPRGSPFSCLPRHMPAAAAAVGTQYSTRQSLVSKAAAPASAGNPIGSSTYSSRASAYDRNGSRDWLLPLLEAFQVQLPDMRMSHLAAVLPALAAVTRKPWNKESLQPLLLQIRLLLPMSAGPEAVAVAAALVQLGAAADVRNDQEWCDAYLHRLHALMRTLGPGDLTAAVKTLAELHIRPYKAWVYELCARLRVEIKNMSSHEVVATLEGLADLRVRLDPEVLHLFVLGIKRWVGFMSPDELTRLVRALNSMYCRPNGRSVLPGRTVHQLVGELERRIRLATLHQGLPL